MSVADPRSNTDDVVHDLVDGLVGLLEAEHTPGPHRPARRRTLSSAKAA